MQWINFDKTESYKKLQEIAKAPVDVKTAMAGEGGAERVAKYKVPMSNGLVYSSMPPSRSMTHCWMPCRDSRMKRS